LKLSLRPIAGLVLLLGCASILLRYELDWSSRPRGADLAVESSRADVRKDRRVSIVVEIVNRGARAALFDIHAVSGWGDHVDSQPLLAPGQRRTWSWVSPRLPSGDYSLALNVEPPRDPIDLDESNNFVRSIVHVASAREAQLRGPNIRMPAVVGLTKVAAARSLRRAGFGTPQWYEHAFGSPADRIDSQWPAPGAHAPRATRTVLIVASEVEVPDLRGLSLDAARQSIDEARLVVGPLSHERAPREKRGAVLGQTPSPGERVRFESAVSLVIGEPRAAWPVPVAASMGVLGLALLVRRRSRDERDVIAEHSAAARPVDVVEPWERPAGDFMPAPLAQSVTTMPQTQPALAPSPMREFEREPEPMPVPVLEPELEPEPEPLPISPPTSAPIASHAAPEPEPAIAADDDTPPTRFENLVFQSSCDRATQHVTWQSPSGTTILLVPVRDLGTQTLRWKNEKVPG
jgi:hypothetical protein